MRELKTAARHRAFILPHPTADQPGNNKIIAMHFDQYRTVEMHRRCMMLRFRVPRAADAILLAVLAGLALT